MITNEYTLSLCQRKFSENENVKRSIYSSLRQRQLSAIPEIYIFQQKHKLHVIIISMQLKKKTL